MERCGSLEEVLGRVGVERAGGEGSLSRQEVRRGHTGGFCGPSLHCIPVEMGSHWNDILRDSHFVKLSSCLSVVSGS